MTTRVERILAQLREIQGRVDRVRAEALANDGRIDDREAAQISRIERRMLPLMRRLERELENDPFDGTVLDQGQTVTFSEAEAGVVEGEVTARSFFNQRRQIVFNSVLIWRNNCRDAVRAIATDMLTDQDSGGSVPRGDLVALARTALSLAGQPHIATAVGVANNLFNLAQRAYESTLPSQPSIRDAKDAWVHSFDQMNEQRIGEMYEGLERVFKEAHGFPADQEYVFGSAARDWIVFTEQFSDGRLLRPSANVRREFMTVCYRAMPDSRWDRDLSSGTIRITLDYDLDRRSFSFDSGEVDDITDEVRAGLNAPNNPVYGNRAVDLPAPMEFRIHGGGGTICEIHRYSPRSGNTDFRLVMRALSPVDLDRQNEVFRDFVSNRAWDVPLARII